MAIEFYDPTGPHGWLANYSPHGFRLDGHWWPTVEHYYQAQKFTLRRIQTLIRLSSSPAKAKLIAHSFSSHKRPRWHMMKETAMYSAISAKFLQHPALARQLLHTGDNELVELTPRDSYWGRTADGLGMNRAGVLLMALRSSLRRRNADADRNET